MHQVTHKWQWFWYHDDTIITITVMVTAYLESIAKHVCVIYTMHDSRRNTSIVPKMFIGERYHL